MVTNGGQIAPGWRAWAVALAASTSFATACVPRDAGYGDVRRLVEQHTGLQMSRQSRPAMLGQEARLLLKRPLTADSAARLALLNSPKVQTAMQQVGVSRGQLVAAAAIPNPVAEAALRFKPDSPTLELGVMEDLTELLLVARKQGSADAALRAAAHEAASAVVDVVFGARADLFTYQAQKQLLELQQNLLTSTYAAYEGAKKLREAGNITELALARHQGRYEQARLAAAGAETALFAARKRLATRLGLWRSDVEWEAAPIEEEPATTLGPDAVKKVLRANLALRGLEHRHRAARERLSYSRVKGWLPELRAGVSAERDEDVWGVGPAVELELPLFYQGQGQVDLARAQVRQLEARLADKAVEVRNAADLAFQHLATVKARLAYLERELLPLQRRLVREAQLQYNAMNLSLFELLAAKNDELDAQRQRIEAQRDLRLARNTVQQLFAGGLPEATSTPMMSADPPGATTGDAH